MIDITKPLELTDGRTVYLDPNSVDNGKGTYNSRWVDILVDGVLRSMPANGKPHPLIGLGLRNKVDVNLVDITKPMYVGGVPVTLRDIRSPWPHYDIDRHTGKRRPYVNVAGSPNGSWTYYIDDGQCQVNPTGPRLSNTKEITMLDLNKPLVVNGKDAKVIHTFPNGNLAVVVDGEGRVYTFHSSGTDERGLGYSQLNNKIVETVRYVNVYPDRVHNGCMVGAYLYETLTGATSGIGKQREVSGAVMIKQTLIDGKVVKSEIVS